MPCRHRTRCQPWTRAAAQQSLPGTATRHAAGTRVRAAAPHRWIRALRDQPHRGLSAHWPPPNPADCLRARLIGGHPGGARSCKTSRRLVGELRTGIKRPPCGAAFLSRHQQNRPHRCLHPVWIRPSRRTTDGFADLPDLSLLIPSRIDSIQAGRQRYPRCRPRLHSRDRMSCRLPERACPHVRYA